MENKNVSEIVRVSNDESRSCPRCDFHLESDRLEENVNHLIKRHGMILLHVGSETHPEVGSLATVAILGVPD